MKISVIHATVRPEQALAVFAHWKAHAITADWEYIIVCSQGKPRVPISGEYQLVICPEPGIVAAYNFGASRSTGDIIMVAADDLYAPQGWDATVALLMGDTTKAKVLAVGDGLRTDRLLCHPILTRKRYEDQGMVIASPSYALSDGIYADNEFTERAYADGVMIEARDIVFRHDHPMRHGNTDAVALEHNKDSNYEKGRRIFAQRNPHAGFGTIAFGVRIGGLVDPSFFYCWSMLLRSSSFRTGDVMLNPSVGLPHGPACNMLLEWFYRSDCDSLMLLDDDMEFTPDAIDRLRSDDYGYDIISGLCVTRKVQHVPIVITGRDPVTNMVQVAKRDEIKNVMPVAYAGFGAIIIKRWVLQKMLEARPGEQLFYFDPRLGEDGRFCEDARAVGARIGCNTGVRFGHRTTVALYWNTEAQAVDFSENDYGFSVLREKERQHEEKTP
jgi:hypothetical protein